VAGAQLERELAALLDLVALEDVGVQLELVVIDDQSGVAVDGHQAGIARGRDQHVELAAMPADAVGAREALDDTRLLRQARGHRRQGARLHLVQQTRRLLQGRQRICGKGGDSPRHQPHQQRLRQNTSLHCQPP